MRAARSVTLGGGTIARLSPIHGATGLGMASLYGTRPVVICSMQTITSDVESEYIETASDATCFPRFCELRL